MWKVKRMNTAGIVVLTIAVEAGGVAHYPASGFDNTLRSTNSIDVVRYGVTNPTHDTDVTKRT
jgi:hypothetical protein